MTYPLLLVESRGLCSSSVTEEILAFQAFLALLAVADAADVDGDDDDDDATLGLALRLDHYL